MDQLPWLEKRELICLLLFTCNYVVSVWRGFLFLWVLGMGYVILLWHSLSLPLIILMSSMIQALIIQIVPIVANDTVYSTNDVNGCRKKFRVYICCFLWCYWLIMIVKLIKHGLVVIPTLLIMIKGSRPF